MVVSHLGPLGTKPVVLGKSALTTERLTVPYSMTRIEGPPGNEAETVLQAQRLLARLWDSQQIITSLESTEEGFKKILPCSCKSSKDQWRRVS